MSWATNCGQSTPKVRAICATWPPWAGANNKSAVMLTPLRARACGALSAHEEQRVKHDRLAASDGQDGLHEDVGGSAGIAPHGTRRRGADQAHTDSRAQGSQADVDATNHDSPAFRCSQSTACVG